MIFAHYGLKLRAFLPWCNCAILITIGILAIRAEEIKYIYATDLKSDGLKAIQGGLKNGEYILMPTDIEIQGLVVTESVIHGVRCIIVPATGKYLVPVHIVDLTIAETEVHGKIEAGRNGDGRSIFFKITLATRAVKCYSERELKNEISIPWSQE